MLHETVQSKTELPRLGNIERDQSISQNTNHKLSPDRFVMRLCSLSLRQQYRLSFPKIPAMAPTAEKSFGLMSDLPLRNILKGLATLATKSNLLWISATGMDTILVTAMLM